uniref:Uncharacterized protein n=1 Tax=Daphnia galeata TaxID=27404 RepID=A0A8J2WGQ4_9CRUS|nr:unnamed protein product [Daphnia galeata]
MPPKRFPKRELQHHETPMIRMSREELAWCIHQLKLSICVTVDAVRKDVTILENPQELLVKKRCIMKMSLGDYRKKMEMEKRKVPLGIVTKCCYRDSVNKYWSVMRKSHIVIAQQNPGKCSFQQSDNSFRFNFDSAQSSPKE